MTTATARARTAGATRRAAAKKRTNTTHPWNALWAMMAGFFMIVLDSTIVAVANPSIMAKLGAGYDTVIWVTSAYLLACAVPLLVAGRLGDRFGPKNLYLVGLAVFTAASLCCGLSGSIGMLVAARVVQGIGAALLTPQTLSLITRVFPSKRRGMAMSVWGATAGVATLLGPVAGGLVVDALGWEWIFFINVPIGVIGLGLAVWLIPVLPTHKHRFDLVGVALSGVGMFLIVFALQEGQSGGWDPWIWAVIVAGVGFMAAFVYWQSINTHEALIPLDIFGDRDFSLANLAVAVIGFVGTAMVLPLMFYAQAVCGLSPTRSALLTAPMAVTNGLLAPIVGKIADRSHPRSVVGFGFSVLAIALTWLSIEMTPFTPIWRLVLPFIAMGVAMAFIWSPLAATATRNLPSHLGGASSGVYYAIRQVGAVLGSAGMASFMPSRITAEMPVSPGGDALGADDGKGTVLQLPEFVREPFAAAMSQSMLLPAFIALFGVAAALFMVGFTASAHTGAPARRRAGKGDDAAGHADGLGAGTRRIRVRPNVAEDLDDGYDDDDDYVEYTLSRAPSASPEPARHVKPTQIDADEDATKPLTAHVDQPRAAPAEISGSSPVESRRSLVDEPAPMSDVEAIGFAHNGFHVNDEQHFRPIEEFVPETVEPDMSDDGDQQFFDDIETYGGPGDRASCRGSVAQPGERRSGYQRPSLHQPPDAPLEARRANHHTDQVRHRLSDSEPPPIRHRRVDPDDTADYGRHSFRDD
jgi:EmrB/QacA subfamily drug resistance transporter